MLETASKLLLSSTADGADLRTVDPETQARLEALLEAAGKLSTADGKAFADPEVLRRLTSSVSCALDEAAAALTRMRAESTANSGQMDNRSLAEACSEGDVNAVRKLLIEGRSVNEHTEEGESLLCLACSAGYYELAQVCLFSIIIEKLEFLSITHSEHDIQFSLLIFTFGSNPLSCGLDICSS
ncbi:hypothetical protein E2320_002510 [Naja naja]|nr:hypothetical protein E2320_002510 [Naja naja]